LVARGSRAQTGNVAQDLVDDTGLVVGGVVGGGGVVIAAEAGVGVGGHCEGSAGVKWREWVFRSLGRAIGKKRGLVEE